MAKKHKFKKKAQAAEKVITMSIVLGPNKKYTSKGKLLQMKQWQRSTIIVEDYD